MMEIDGSWGEGGGQILRTSLTLSLVTGTACRITHIRSGRKKPGLLRQHLTAVRAIEALGAEVDGAELGSSTVEIRPRTVRGGDFHFAIGSAGSVGLVFQTVLPALLAAGEAARLSLQGGTHNPWSPPFDYLERVYLPSLARMGAKISLDLITPGFHPAGGGNMDVDIAASEPLRPVALVERGPVTERRARAIACQLPASIAERELQVVRKELGWSEDEAQLRTLNGSAGPGNVLLLEVQHGMTNEMTVGFGERGVRAETVAKRAAKEMKLHLESDAAVGVRLADQLMVPMAIAGEGSFRTSRLTEHARTNLEVIRQFLPIETRVSEEERSVVVEMSSA